MKPDRQFFLVDARQPGDISTLSPDLYHGAVFFTSSVRYEKIRSEVLEEISLFSVSINQSHRSLVKDEDSKIHYGGKKNNTLTSHRARVPIRIYI